MRNEVCFWGLTLLLLIPASSRADLTQDRLEAGHAHLKAKHFKSAIHEVEPLLDQLALDTVEEIIMAHRILGVAYCELGDQAKAADHFKTLLTFSPTDTVDEFVVTKPCQNLFAGIKSGKPDEMPAARPVQNPAAAAAPSAPAVEKKEATPSDGRWKRFVPFGVGQFANGQRTKGIAFLSTEVAAAALAGTAFALFKSEEDSDGTFGNADSASTYRALYWSSMGVGAAAMVWGITDAVIVQTRQQAAAASIQITPSGVYVAYKF